MSKQPIVLGIGEVLWDMLPDGKHCGGATANVVYHLSKLGIPSAMVSSVGNDELGKELLSFLISRNISTEYVSSNDFATGVVEVTLNNGIPKYDICQPSAWDFIELSDKILQILPEIKCVVFGTLAQRNSVSRETIQTILKSLPNTCLKVFDINLRQQFYSRELIQESLNFCNVLKINDEELDTIAKLFEIGESREDVMQKLFVDYSIDTVILTLGEKGSVLFDGNNFYEYPVIPCNVVDTVGCGDAFLAGWCSAILKGMSLGEAMQEGTKRSAMVASQKGAME